MSDPNAVSWSEHRTFSGTLGGLASGDVLLTVMQPIFSGSSPIFWEVVGPAGVRSEGHCNSFLEAKRSAEAEARAMRLVLVKK